MLKKCYAKKSKGKLKNLKICHLNWFTRKCFSTWLKARRKFKNLTTTKILILKTFLISEKTMLIKALPHNSWKMKKSGSRKMGGLCILRNIKKEFLIMLLLWWAFNLEALLKILFTMLKNSFYSFLLLKSTNNNRSKYYSLKIAFLLKKSTRH